MIIINIIDYKVTETRSLEEKKERDNSSHARLVVEVASQFVC